MMADQPAGGLLPNHAYDWSYEIFAEDTGSSRQFIVQTEENPIPRGPEAQKCPAEPCKAYRKPGPPGLRFAPSLYP